MAGLLRSALLEGIPHGFSTSDASGVPQIMAGAHSFRLKQVHSATAIPIGEDQSWPDTARPEGDALVTDRPGRILAIVTADCAPVLLADRTAGVVAAAHAGWRGAHGGVIANTVDAMEALGATRSAIEAVIGPTIAQRSYEVDAAFRDRFGDADAAFFAAGRAGHFQFDLPAYVAAQLARAGVASVEDLAENTYDQPGRYHSFRRATHQGTPTDGRQYSVIGLPAAVA